MTPPRQRAAAAETATARLARLLTLVPWLSNRPGISVDDAAKGLGISEAQLRADLDLIFVCGYGQMPDEMIEVDAEGDRIVVRNAETIARPLRLGVDEAITLMVGLRALGNVPGLTDTDAIDRALARLEEQYGKKQRQLETQLEKALSRVGKEQGEVRARGVETALSVGAAILGAFLGRKPLSMTTATRSAAFVALRSAWRIAASRRCSVSCACSETGRSSAARNSAIASVSASNGSPSVRASMTSSHHRSGSS